LPDAVHRIARRWGSEICSEIKHCQKLKALAEKDKRVHIIKLDVVNDADIAAAAKQVHTIVGMSLIA
jgi:hypothetical protein